MTLETAKARCWAEIDLDALKHNYLEALSILDGRAQLICVLKANAYGLGAKRVAKELYELGARFFAVACACEAEEIRPIVPGAEILSFDDGRIHVCGYEDTESYRVTKLFLEHREQMLTKLGIG